MKSKILITGAGGFLGGRTTKYFAADNNYEVVATSRRSDRKEELEETGAFYVSGDLSDVPFCEKITQGVNIVIHCAALSSPFGSYAKFYSANYVATKQLLEASIKNDVTKFILISTPSIYFNFTDRFNVKESDPLPEKMVNAYAETKLLAEKLVLAQNGNNIQTIALRPRAIIGAEDTVIFPRLFAAYEAKRLKIIGKGDNICDLTCVSNVIEAIGCAINAKEKAYGEAYNITDGESVNFWEAVNYALSALDYTPVNKHVPKQLAMLAATVIEQKAKWTRNSREPALTRYGIGILCHHFTLDINKAKTMLGYQPVYKTMDGINEYITWHKNQK